VNFDASAKIGAVSPLLFGVNHRWASYGVGSADPQTGITYPQVSKQIKDIGFSMIRYPAGTLANTFQWSKAIGPQAQRSPQVGGLLKIPGPEDSTFGPDEYGNLLDVTGATGDLMLNFATASAADAANFVAYMTLPQGGPPVNGVDWAARRAANGHPAPYKIAYAEIGNEYDPWFQSIVDENYWIKGEPVTISPSCTSSKIACLYAFGGSTRFTAQPVVAQADWRAPTSVSSGAANQLVYARYAPVLPGSETIYVAGVAWQRVTSLASAASTDSVYQINDATGAIQFGDGVHGAIPASGATITVTYTSGPHGGFVDYYSAIKAANPSIKVCSSVYDSSFIQIMGAQYAYDCIVQHPYYVVDPTKVAGLEDYSGQAMQATEAQAAAVAATQAAIKQYAGSNAPKVSMLLSEYGQTGTMPSFAPHFLRSTGEGVIQGLFLRQWMLLGIEAAERHVLTDYTYGTSPPDLAAMSAGKDGSMLQGPGPNMIESPMALAMKLFTHNVGTTLVRSSVTGNPNRTLSNGNTLAALQTVGTTDAAGNAYLIVINEDPTNPVDAAVWLQNLQNASSDGIATVSTLTSASIVDDNQPANPNAVQIVQGSVPVGGSIFDWSFPAHSITAIAIASRP
jgi:alpha-N-arabinofuranosidase